MKNIKKYLFIISSAVLLLTGCGNKENIKTETPDEEQELETDNTETEINEKLNGLIENEDPDLEVTAAVLERKAILSGSAIPLNVTITNKGTNKIIYVLGSGSFKTPQAMFLDIPELQPILPQDYLGAATLDLQYRELMPGESLQYTQYIRAIEPNKEFDEYTYEKWQKDQLYIADIEWSDLKTDYSDLQLIPPGSYEGSVYFLYYIADSNQEIMPSNATGYTAGKFLIGVTE